MSVMNSIVETVARFMPDQERDPLLNRDGFLGKSVPLDYSRTALLLSHGRAYSIPDSLPS